MDPLVQWNGHREAEDSPDGCVGGVCRDELGAEFQDRTDPHDVQNAPQPASFRAATAAAAPSKTPTVSGVSPATNRRRRTEPDMAQGHEPAPSWSRPGAGFRE